MAALYRSKIAVLVILFFTGSHLAHSQDPQSWFYEKEFELSIPVDSDWSMDVGLGYRGMLQERDNGEKTSGYQNEHLELNYFSNYQLNASSVVSLGLRYRSKEIFDSAEEDEIRIIEQVALAAVDSQFSHRFRLEQRFKENTEHRIRYELSYSTALQNNYTLNLGTEALYNISTALKPEAEQRFSIGLKALAFEDVDLELGFEYRLENYAQDLTHEFFLVTGISYSL